MSISEKIKTIDNKIEQNKTQYDLDRQTAKISALSAGNFNKCEFLTGKDVLPEKDLSEKAVTLKRFEYLPLGKELKAQTSVAKEQYQGLIKPFRPDEKKESTIKNYNKSNLMYDRKCSFYKYRDSEEFNNISFKSKYLFLFEFFNDLNKFDNLKAIKEKKTKKGKNKSV